MVLFPFLKVLCIKSKTWSQICMGFFFWLTSKNSSFLPIFPHFFPWVNKKSTKKKKKHRLNFLIYWWMKPFRRAGARRLKPPSIWEQTESDSRASSCSAQRRPAARGRRLCVCRRARTHTADPERRFPNVKCLWRKCQPAEGWEIKRLFHAGWSRNCTAPVRKTSWQRAQRSGGGRKIHYWFHFKAFLTCLKEGNWNPQEACKESRQLCPGFCAEQLQEDAGYWWAVSRSEPLSGY